MLVVNEIETLDDLQAWLKGMPQQTVREQRFRHYVTSHLAVRAAARAVPIMLMSYEGGSSDQIALLQLLRCCLAASVAASSPEVKLLKATHRAMQGAYFSDWPSASARVACAVVCDASIEPVSGTVQAITLGVDAATLNAPNASDYMLVSSVVVPEAILRGQAEFLQLWPQSGNPFSKIWESYCDVLADEKLKKRTASSRLVNWDFWVDWYSSLTGGQPMQHSLLKEIALLGDDLWDQGPAVINPVINEIRQRHARERTYNAERITQSAETGRLDVVVERPLSELRLSDVQAKMLEAASVFDGEGGENGPYGGLSSEVELIRQAAARKDPRSIGLYDACRRAAKRAMGKAARGECPQDDLVEDFAEQLTETAFDISGFDEDVRQVVANRATLKLEERVQADPAIAAEVLPGLAVEVDQVSEGDLQAEFAADAQIASDPDADARSRGNALYRLASRTFRIVQWLGKATAGTLKVLALVPGALAGIKLVVASPAFQAALRYLQSFF